MLSEQRENPYRQRRQHISQDPLALQFLIEIVLLLLQAARKKLAQGSQSAASALSVTCVFLSAA